MSDEDRYHVSDEEMTEIKSRLSTLDHRFGHHPPTSEADENAHARIRRMFRSMAQIILTDIPEGREQSICLTKVEEAMFWANAGIARKRARK